MHVWLGTILLLRRDAPAAPLWRSAAGWIAPRRATGWPSTSRSTTWPRPRSPKATLVAARSHLNEGIALSEQNHDLANLAYFLEALAVVESAEDGAGRVPVLLGAAQTLHETTDHKTYGYYLPDDSLRERAEQQARLALGDLAYLEAVEAGRRLDVQGSARFALRAPPG